MSLNEAMALLSFTYSHFLTVDTTGRLGIATAPSVEKKIHHSFPSQRTLLSQSFPVNPSRDHSRLVGPSQSIFLNSPPSIEQ